MAPPPRRFKPGNQKVRVRVLGSVPERFSLLLCSAETPQKMPDAFHALEETVTRDVTRALAEDIGTGDLTANLVPASATATARLMTRRSGVLCGVEWFKRTFEELDPDVEIFWHHADGDDIVSGSSLCELEGNARAILSGRG